MNNVHGKGNKNDVVEKYDVDYTINLKHGMTYFLITCMKRLIHSIKKKKKNIGRIRFYECDLKIF